MNSSPSAFGFRGPVFCVAVILGLQFLGFAPVAGWWLLTGWLPVGAVCLDAILVAAMNAVGIICLFAGSDSSPQQTWSVPRWIEKTGSVVTGA